VFSCAEGRSKAHFQPRPEHQGYAGISHGGVLAALLDEAMVYAAVTLGRWVTTAELTVRYLRPAPTGQPFFVAGEVVRHQRQMVVCKAEIRGGDGELLAFATGKLLQSRELREDEQPGRTQSGTGTL